MSTVLLVDDSPADRALFRLILGRAGFSVHELSRGLDAVAKALEPLDGVVRQRVISWAASRFGASLPAPNESSGTGRHTVSAGESVRGEFESFAELFEAADPKTDKDRALIAAYWTQICQSQANFPVPSGTWLKLEAA